MRLTRIPASPDGLPSTNHLLYICSILFNPHTCRCSSGLTAANSSTWAAATAAPPPLLADADVNENLLMLPRRAASRAASLVAPRACATRARLMARCGGVCSAMAISL
jgi:hypothetical protein